MAALPNPLETTTLSSVQIHAVALLAAGNSITSSAQHAGVHRATLYNWLKLPDFRAALDEARRDYVAFMHARLREIAELAVDTIRHSLTNPEVSASVKLRAAIAVLDRPLFPKPGAPVPQESEDFPAESPAPQPSAGPEIARNAPCPCGSGNKYKRCCGTNAPPVLCRAA